jgi:hypothetical protein
MIRILDQFLAMNTHGMIIGSLTKARAGGRAMQRFGSKLIMAQTTQTGPTTTHCFFLSDALLLTRCSLHLCMIQRGRRTFQQKGSARRDRHRGDPSRAPRASIERG